VGESEFHEQKAGPKKRRKEMTPVWTKRNSEKGEGTVDHITGRQTSKLDKEGGRRGPGGVIHIGENPQRGSVLNRPHLNGGKGGGMGLSRFLARAKKRTRSSSR